MIVSRKCPKCGSEKIAGPHKLHGGDGHVSVNLPGFSTATLESFTCANCGYTELYADRIGLSNIRDSGRFVLNSELDIARRSHPKECRRCGCINEIGATICKECGAIL